MNCEGGRSSPDGLAHGGASEACNQPDAVVVQQSSKIEKILAAGRVANVEICLTEGCGRF